MQTDQQPNLQPSPDTVPQPVPTPEVLPPIPQKHANNMVIFGIIGIIAFILIVVNVVVQHVGIPKGNTKLTKNTTQITPTVTPTPPLALIATTSAYLNLKASVAELAATLNAYPLNDQTLNPPILELNLGFSN